MTAALRKLSLTAHVVASVGWLGAVAAFLSLSLAGLYSGRPETMGAAYLAMQMITWAVIVPLSGASLVTGVIQSLGTPWGLFRHYWVVAKLGIAVVASLLLVLHTQPIGAVAAVAAERPIAPVDLRQLRLQLVADSVAAVVALIAATALSIYKPQGLTSYGRAAQSGAGDVKELSASDRRWRKWGIIATVLVVFFGLLKHLANPGFSHH